MTYQIPVLDLAAALSDDPPAELLADARAAAERIGIIAVRNHGVDQALIDDFTERAGRLLSLPRAEKAKLASPHPYRGWRQWPDDFGRLELERFNVAQFDTMADAQAAGLPPEYLGLYAHQNRWPAGEPGLRAAAFRYLGPPAASPGGCSGCTPGRWTCLQTPSSSARCRNCGSP